MQERIKKVVLEAGEVRREFEITHAERLLRMPNNGGWHFPQDSDFEITEQNGVELRRNKESNKKSEK
jgi:hypothetical protein